METSCTRTAALAGLLHEVSCMGKEEGQSRRERLDVRKSASKQRLHVCILAAVEGKKSLNNRVNQAINPTLAYSQT